MRSSPDSSDKVETLGACITFKISDLNVKLWRTSSIIGLALYHASVAGDSNLHFLVLF